MKLEFWVTQKKEWDWLLLYGFNRWEINTTPMQWATYVIQQYEVYWHDARQRREASDEKGKEICNGNPT